MTFDQWIDSVNAEVHGRVGQVRTEELSWDSAHWVAEGGHVVAALDETETTAVIDFDNGERLAVPFRSLEGNPEVIGRTIAAHLTR